MCVPIIIARVLAFHGNITKRGEVVVGRGVGSPCLREVVGLKKCNIDLLG